MNSILVSIIGPTRTVMAKRESIMTIYRVDIFVATPIQIRMDPIYNSVEV